MGPTQRSISAAGVRSTVLGTAIFTSMSNPTVSGTLANTCSPPRQAAR